MHFVGLKKLPGPFLRLTFISRPGFLIRKILIILFLRFSVHTGMESVYAISPGEALYLCNRVPPKPFELLVYTFGELVMNNVLRVWREEVKANPNDPAVINVPFVGRGTNFYTFSNPQPFHELFMRFFREHDKAPLKGIAKFIFKKDLKEKLALFRSEFIVPSLIRKGYLKEFPLNYRFPMMLTGKGKQARKLLQHQFGVLRKNFYKWARQGDSQLAMAYYSIGPNILIPDFIELKSLAALEKVFFGCGRRLSLAKDLTGVKSNLYDWDGLDFLPDFSMCKGLDWAMLRFQYAIFPPKVYDEDDSDDGWWAAAAGIGLVLADF